MSELPYDPLLDGPRRPFNAPLKKRKKRACQHYNTRLTSGEGVVCLDCRRELVSARRVKS